MRNRSGIWVILLAALIIVGCFKEDDYERNDANGFVNLIIDEQVPLPADGVASGRVEILLDSQAGKSRRTVKLKTDLGSFSGGSGDSISVTVDHNFKGHVKLISTKAGVATVTAFVENLKKEADGKIEFVQAWPDGISVAVDSFSVSNSFKSEAILTARLSRGKGVPSVKQMVRFAVFNSAGQSIGAFLNDINTAESDASGKATIRYTAGNSGQTGRLTIIAETKLEDQTSIKATTYIYLTP